MDESWPSFREETARVWGRGGKAMEWIRGMENNGSGPYGEMMLTDPNQEMRVEDDRRREREREGE